MMPPAGHFRSSTNGTKANLAKTIHRRPTVTLALARRCLRDGACRPRLPADCQGFTAQRVWRQHVCSKAGQDCQADRRPYFGALPAGRRRPGPKDGHAALLPARDRLPPPARRPARGRDAWPPRRPRARPRQRVRCLAPHLLPPPPSAPIAAPEASFKQWVQALRTNDLALLYRALTGEQRALIEKTWTIQATTPDADGDKQLNSGLGLLLSPNAVDLLVAQAQPDLATLNPQDLVIGLQQVGGFLALAGSQPKDAKAAGDAPTLDFAALQGFLADIGGWIPLAGINDAAKLHQAVAHVVAGARSLGVKSALEVRALKTEDVLHRLSAGLGEIKAALLVYGLDANALLDSITFATAEGSGDQRTVTIGFTAFGHAHRIPVKVVRKDDVWTFAEGKDSPFAPLSQLMMMAMMMNSAGSDALAPAPAPAGQPKPKAKAAPSQPPL